MTDEAFVESTEEPTRVSGKKFSLPLTEDGSIDWDNASDKHKRLFIQAIKSDPNGILQNIQEEAGAAPADTGIADATVVAAANAILAVEAIGFTTIGPRFAPVLKNLHPVVAISACTVTEEEMQPVMPAAKRIIAEYMPPELGKYQDLIVVGQHLLKLSAAKFKHCIDLAMEIERVKASGQSSHVAAGPQNGKATTIESEGHIIR
jgi:hypothetical protein